VPIYNAYASRNNVSLQSKQCWMRRGLQQRHTDDLQYTFDNILLSRTAAGGGGLYNTGTATLQDDFYEQTARRVGGAIVTKAARVTLINRDRGTNSTAPAAGAALLNGGGSSVLKLPTFSNQNSDRMGNGLDVNGGS